jgi:hypothetical protein
MDGDNSSGSSFVIRFHMVVNKHAHADVEWLLGGLTNRERNRKIQGLLLRAAHAERYGQGRPPASSGERAARTPHLPKAAASEAHGLLPGMEASDVLDAFGQFADAEPLPANS